MDSVNTAHGLSSFPLTSAAFADAARKGLGRALVALRDGSVAPSYNQLRRLALRWQGYDSRFDGARGWYGAELIRHSGHEAALRGLLLKLARRTRGPSRHLSHRDAVIEEFARRGDETARQILFVCFEPNLDYRFAESIIRVDGIEGLDWVVRQVAPIFTENKARQVHWWREEATSIAGKEAVAEWLARESSQPYRELVSWERPPRLRRRPEPRQSFEALCASWRDGKSKRFAPTHWVREASADEREQAWTSFRESDDEPWLQALGRGFRHKPDPRHLPWLMDRAWSWTGEWSNPFVTAMEEIIDGRVRELGIEMLAKRASLSGLSLLELNALSEDVEIVMKAVQTIHDEDGLHGAGMSLLRIGERLPAAEPLLWVYEKSPCSFCRETAVRQLVATRLAPREVLEECLFDSVDETREMAAEELT